MKFPVPSTIQNISIPTDNDKWVDLPGLFGAIDLIDEQNIAIDGPSLESENEEDDEVSRTDKAIILGLESIIEELQYNNSNIDNLREEFNDFRDENEEKIQEIIESKDKYEKILFRSMADDLSSIRSILFWVLIGIPVIVFFMMMAMAE